MKTALKKLYEYMGWCWHDWAKWQDRGEFQGTKWQDVGHLQSKRCTKCNKRIDRDAQ